MTVYLCLQAGQIQNSPVRCTAPRDSRWDLWRSPGFFPLQNNHRKRMSAVCRLNSKRKPVTMLLEDSRRNRQNRSQSRKWLIAERRKGNEESPMTPLHSRDLMRMFRVQGPEVFLIQAQPVMEMQHTSCQGQPAKHECHSGTTDYIISMGLDLQVQEFYLGQIQTKCIILLKLRYLRPTYQEAHLPFHSSPCH